MSRPDRTITCAQVTLVEAADTLETSSVGVEVMPGVGKKKLCCCWYIHSLEFIASTTM